MSIIPSPWFYIWPDKLHLALRDAKKVCRMHKGKTGRDFVAAAVRSDSSPSTAMQASLRSPGGRSIPSMVYLCIHIGGEWKWSLLSIVCSLNVFRKPSIVLASSILGSINSEIWPSVFSLARICTINTHRPCAMDAKRDDFSPHQMPWEWGNLHGAAQQHGIDLFLCIKETHLHRCNLSGVSHHVQRCSRWRSHCLH